MHRQETHEKSKATNSTRPVEKEACWYPLAPYPLSTLLILMHTFSSTVNPLSAHPFDSLHPSAHESMLVKFKRSVSSYVTPSTVRFSLLACRLIVSLSWLFLTSLLPQIWSDFSVNVRWLCDGLMLFWLLWIKWENKQQSFFVCVSISEPLPSLKMAKH